MPSSRIDVDIPILRWDPATNMNFKSLLEFGQEGYAFIYRSQTTAGQKLLPRSEYGGFI